MGSIFSMPKMPPMIPINRGLFSLLTHTSNLLFFLSSKSVRVLGFSGDRGKVQLKFAGATLLVLKIFSFIVVSWETGALGILKHP